MNGNPGSPNTVSCFVWCVAAVCTWAAGCGNSKPAREPGPRARAPAPARPEPTRAEPRPSESENARKTSSRESRPEPGLIRITAAEAAAKKLPAIGFSLKKAGAPWVVNRFIGPDVYLVLSGPPGGPLSFSVRGYKSAKHDQAALEKLVRSHFRRYKPLVMGKAATFTLAGAGRPARPFITGTSLSRTVWCAALVPAPGGKPHGLLVAFGVRAGTRTLPNCNVPANHSALKPVVDSFRLER